jgi:hypothetical protein
VAKLRAGCIFGIDDRDQAQYLVGLWERGIRNQCLKVLAAERNRFARERKLGQAPSPAKGLPGTETA